MSSALSTVASRLRAPQGGGPAGGPPPRGRLFGFAGIALAVIAFLITLPPFESRTMVPSVIIGFTGVVLGVDAIRTGHKRVGWGAVVASLAAMLGAYGAVNAAMLRYATPLTFAALGGLVSERSGVVNIALEGMMLMGAFFAAYGADKTGSWALGVLIGVLAGMALAAIHAIWAVSLRADQIVSGTALNFLAVGITGYMYINTYGEQGTPDNLPAVPEIHLPTDSLGFIGQAISDLNLLVWGSLVAVFIVWVVVF